MSGKLGFSMTYDEDGDVLYIAKSREAAARGTEDEDRIVWRYDAAGELIGATILGFHERWLNDRSRLALELSSRFQIPLSRAGDAVDDAFDVRAPLG